MYLPKNALAAGKTLERLDYTSTNVQEVTDLIKAVPMSDDAKWFPYFFSGARFAKAGRLDDAQQLLCKIREPNAFVRNYRQYIQANRTARHDKTTFSTTTPYDAWLLSGYCQTHYNLGTEMVANALAETPGQVIRVLDVGVGNGVFAAGYLREAAEKSGKMVRLVINDQSENMIAAATDKLQPLLGVSLQELAVCVGGIQDVDISNLHPQDWVFCGASIHHMPREQKVIFLTALKNVTRGLMILDFHCNHDVPRSDSLELYYSVAWHYGYYIADVETSEGLTNEAKELAINEVLLAEALKILSEPRERRVDYHMPAEAWVGLLAECGYKNIGFSPVVVDGERMLSFLVTASAEDHS